MENKYNILVLEDSPIVQHLVTVNLKKNFNCQTTCVESTAQAIDEIIKESPDLMILDYYLGSFVERDYPEKIIEYAESKNIFIPMIFFTSVKDNNIISNLYNKGVYRIVSKNSDNFLEDLNQTIRSALKWV